MTRAMEKPIVFSATAFTAGVARHELERGGEARRPVHDVRRAHQQGEDEQHPDAHQRRARAPRRTTKDTAAASAWLACIRRRRS